MEGKQRRSAIADIWPKPEGEKDARLQKHMIDGHPYIVCLPPQPYVPETLPQRSSSVAYGDAAAIWAYLRKRSQDAVSVYWAYSEANVSGMGPAYVAFSGNGQEQILIPVFGMREFKLNAGFHLCFLPLDDQGCLADISDISESEKLVLGTLYMGETPLPESCGRKTTPSYIQQKALRLGDTDITHDRFRISVRRVGCCFVSELPLLKNVPYDALAKAGLASPYRSN